MIRSFFGFIGDFVSWFFSATMLWGRRALVGIIAGLLIVFLGIDTAAGVYMVPLGVALSFGSFILLIIATAIPRAGLNTAGRKWPEFGSELQAIYTLILVGFIAVTSLVYANAYRHPELLKLGGALLLLFGMSMMFPGVSRKLFAVNVRLALGLMIWTTYAVYLNTPDEMKRQIVHGIYQKSGQLDSYRVNYTLESLLRDEPPIFKSIPDANGQPQPNVWVCYDEFQESYILYDNRRVCSDGTPAKAGNVALRKKIIAHLRAREEKENLRRKAEETLQRQKDETERQAAEEAERERQRLREVEQAAVRDERVLLKLVITSSFSTKNKVGDIFPGRLVEPVTFQGYYFPAGRTIVTLRMETSQSRGNGLMPYIVLVPTNMRVTQSDILIDPLYSDEIIAIAGDNQNAERRQSTGAVIKTNGKHLEVSSDYRAEIRVQAGPR